MKKFLQLLILESTLPEDDDIHAYFDSNTKCIELSKSVWKSFVPNWSKVSKKQPYRVQKNVAFMINLADEDPMIMIHNLESDNGAYKCMGTRTTTWQTVVEILHDFKVKEFKDAVQKKKRKLWPHQMTII